jgi:hypothetical protein
LHLLSTYRPTIGLIIIVLIAIIPQPPCIPTAAATVEVLPNHFEAFEIVGIGLLAELVGTGEGQRAERE